LTEILRKQKNTLYLKINFDEVNNYRKQKTERIVQKVACLFLFMFNSSNENEVNSSYFSAKIS